MLRCEKGATLAEIGKATGWQNHSIRGFISLSGDLIKKMGLSVESTKDDAGSARTRSFSKTPGADRLTEATLRPRTYAVSD
jgi:hypothetical protein